MAGPHGPGQTCLWCAPRRAPFAWPVAWWASWVLPFLHCRPQPRSHAECCATILLSKPNTAHLTLMGSAVHTAMIAATNSRYSSRLQAQGLPITPCSGALLEKCQDCPRSRAGAQALRPPGRQMLLLQHTACRSGCGLVPAGNAADSVQTQHAGSTQAALGASRSVAAVHSLRCCG